MDTLIGKKFSRLTVTAFIGRNSSRNSMWRCRCDCGNDRHAIGSDLQRGRAVSCGCLQREKVAATGRSQATHGLSSSPEYGCWTSLIARCTSTSRHNFRAYGGRGIKVCDRWRESFEAFLADMGPRPTPSHSIDRIDVNGHYEPGNCRWATHAEQARNTRRGLVQQARSTQPA